MKFKFLVLLIVLVFLLFNLGNVGQASTGLVITNGAGGQGANAWTNPIQAQGTTDDNSYATANTPNGSRVSGIWNNYNFDTNLPLNAAITKVEIIPQYKVNSTLFTATLEVMAVVGGANCPASPLISGSEPTVDTDFIADVTACRSWTRSDLLNSSFAASVAARCANCTVAGVAFSLDYVKVRITYNTPDYEQAAYRWYDNTDSTTVGAPLAGNNSSPTLYAPADRVRLRVLLHVTTTTLLTSSQQFKLQLAQKTTTCAGLSYTDVTASSEIAYYNNPTPASGANLTLNAQDPQHATDTIVQQTYNESSPFSTVANVPVAQDGLWDIALVGNGALPNTAYCFRMTYNDGTPLTTYSVFPELVTSAAGNLSVDIVDLAASSVPAPAFSFTNLQSPINCATSTATLGLSSQKIRAVNTTSSPGWSLTIAATNGSTALWSAGTPKYDFNDNAGSPAGCAAGLDSDTYGGQMAINASAATLTPRAVSACSNSGLSKGAAAVFVEGTVNAITLLSAAAGAPTGCFWDLTNTSVSQNLPGGQTPGSYSISMTLTMVAN